MRGEGHMMSDARWGDDRWIVWIRASDQDALSSFRTELVNVVHVGRKRISIMAILRS